MLETRTAKQACIWLAIGTISKSAGFINLALLEMVPCDSRGTAEIIPRDDSLPIQLMILKCCYQHKTHETCFKRGECYQRLLNSSNFILKYRAIGRIKKRAHFLKQLPLRAELENGDSFSET